MGLMRDEELVARYLAQPGSPEADACLNELFQRYRGKVALWCLRLAGDREAAADLAQEILLKAFRSIASFRGEAKFSTWLYTISRNHCFKELKARAAAAESSGDAAAIEVADQSPNPLAQLESASSAQMVRELIASALSEVETRVMTLHFVDELPLDNITRLLQLDNTSGAKAYIVSAKRKLNRAAEAWRSRGQRVQK
ncbi:MAG TPA: sigma-70 family RNA polymerase sigma factor [Bryobacteraceae bacterium]|nr:sigma-70 family RNA polymerase sigma factor [Bryobacteraceae bacterium]